MAVIDIDKHRVITKAPEKEPERPREWAVVMHYEASSNLRCCVCLLHEVFNQTNSQATGHIENAIKAGRERVYTHSRDVVETKTEEANKARDLRAKSCSPGMRQVSFTPEPA